MSIKLPLVTVIAASALLAHCGRQPSISTTKDEPVGATVKLVSSFHDFTTGLAYADGKIFSSSIYDSQVRVFDAQTHAEGAAIRVGRGPFRLLHDRGSIYTVNQWARESGDAYLSIIDAHSGRVVSPLRVAEHRQGNDPDNYPWTNFPQDVAVLGNQLFVTFPTNAIPNIMPVDMGSWREHTMFAAGSGPWRLTAVGGVLVVLNERNMGAPDDAILLYSAGGQLLKTFETPGFVRQAITAGGRAWVSRSGLDGEGNIGKGFVMVIDPVTQEMRQISVGHGPDGLAEHDGKIYVICVDEKMVTVIDQNTEKVIGRISMVDGSQNIPRPRSLVVTDSGDLIVKSVDGSTAGLPTAGIYAVTPAAKL